MALSNHADLRNPVKEFEKKSFKLKHIVPSPFMRGKCQRCRNMTALYCRHFLTVQLCGKGQSVLSQPAAGGCNTQ